MKIFLFTVQHKRPSWLAQQQVYYHRLPSYVRFNGQHIAPSNKKREAQELLKLSHKIADKNAIKIALCVEGVRLSSEQFAKKIEYWQHMSNKVIFYIGGADGLHQTLVEQCHLVWSFSPLTFSHSLAQLIFSEQLYRAFSILQGHPYHLSH